MANSALRNESCSYQEQLRRSIGPGMYMLGTPANDCGASGGCAKDVPADPYVRYQHWGPGTCAPGKAVNDESELRGINYKTSKCNADQYVPGKYSATGACQVPGAKVDPRRCATPTENTRLSNPPCTLRGTGWNRWEWLCYDPQDRAIIPFEYVTSYRIVAKDNHKPCLETPIDQSGFMPVAKAGQAVASWTAPEGCGAAAPGNPFDRPPAKCQYVKSMTA